MDAITLLKNDHKTMLGLFKQFEKASGASAKRDLAEKIIEEMSVHAAVEEQVFYPAVREGVPGTTSTVLESLEEHHVAKLLGAELDGMDPDDERFDAKMTVLIENVRHHISEEEGELFPEVRQTLKRKVLGDIGETIEKAKKTAPTRPHPKAPDEPPANVVAGAGAAAVDKARDAGRKAVRKKR